MTEDRSREAARREDAARALQPPVTFAHESTARLAGEPKSSPFMALEAVNRQLAKVNISLTALHAASEQITTLMLERFNGEWDVLDARLKVLARTAVDHDGWTRRPVAKIYERLRQLLERGIVCRPKVVQQAGDLREFLEQLRRLTKRLLVHCDRNQKRRDERPGGDDLSGRRLGEFVLRGRIGAGGFGAVYSCEQPLLGREAVVKVLHRELCRSDIIVRRFLREARLASRLDHPYAAHIYAFGIEADDRLLWIAMERVHGVTLAQWVTSHGPVPLGQFVAFFERIAAVVQTAHERGIVHRDLKPSNVMVIERAGELLPKLLDFGVAKLLDDAVPPEGVAEINYPLLPAFDESGNSPPGVVCAPGKSTVTDPSVALEGGLTQDNHTVGSPPYMSPEQCWDRIEPVGDLRVCIRGLRDLDDEAWLARTFESTMHLARVAKPRQTIYVPPWHGPQSAAFAPWWEYGDIIADERAGYPALSFVGYAPSVRTVEYAGFCTTTDIAKGGPDPRHVLIREIHEVRALIKAKKDREGRPVDTVRIVFAEEWMARRERRPLLDVGARVFFMDPKTGNDVEIND